MEARTVPAAPGLDTVARVAPAAAAGWRRMRGPVDADGALPASVKALLVAVAAAARGHDALAARELARGRGLGLGEDEIAAAATTLLLSRGEGVLGRFAAAAGTIEPAAAPRPADERDATRYFLDYQGEGSPDLAPRTAALAQLAPEAFEGYHELHHGALRADPAASRLAEMVLVALNAAELEGPYVAVHAAAARRVGVTEAELVETVLCAVPVSGIGAWASAFEALTAGAASG